MMDWQEMYPQYLFINLLVGLGLAVLFGWLAIWVARKIGPMDLPGILPHKKHGAPTPLAGGVVLVVAFIAGGLIFNFPMLKELWPILIPALIVFAVALWDDFKQLPAGIKLCGQIVAGILLMALGTHVQILKPSFLGLGETTVTCLNWFITLFWIVGMTNAMNFVDSMDGLVIGISGVVISFLILVTLGSTQEALLRLLTLLLGICIGFYFYNITPARSFLGDSGAQTLGFLLAAVSILFTPGAHPQASSWFVPIMILGVPIFDTTLVVFSRLRHKTPIYSAGRDHTFHRLVALGLDDSRAVVVMHFASIVLGCLSFIALRLPPLYANLTFGIVCLISLVVMARLISRDRLP